MSELYELFSQHPRISTDTRRIEPDSIFFALRGDTFDGNRFVAEAVSYTHLTLPTIRLV